MVYIFFFRCNRCHPVDTATSVGSPWVYHLQQGLPTLETRYCLSTDSHQQFYPLEPGHLAILHSPPPPPPLLTLLPTARSVSHWGGGEGRGARSGQRSVLKFWASAKFPGRNSLIIPYIKLPKGTKFHILLPRSTAFAHLDSPADQPPPCIKIFSAGPLQTCQQSWLAVSMVAQKRSRRKIFRKSRHSWRRRRTKFGLTYIMIVPISSWNWLIAFEILPHYNIW